MESPTPDRVLTIATDAAPGATRLLVAGELDAHSAAELTRALDDVDASATVDIDLAGVSFVDSSGLAALLEARRRRDAAGGRLVVSAASEAVNRLFNLTGVRDHLMRPIP